MFYWHTNQCFKCEMGFKIIICKEENNKFGKLSFVSIFPIRKITDDTS